MVGLWSLIELDFVDNLAEPWDTVVTVADVLAILTMGGVYSAMTAIEQPEKAGGWPYLIGIGFRTAMLIGLSATVLSVFGD